MCVCECVCISVYVYNFLTTVTHVVKADTSEKLHSLDVGYTLTYHPHGGLP